MSYQVRSVSKDARPIERILDLARWAPSGDNTQPWRFEIVNDHHLVVHGHDTRDHVVYDLDGRASQLAIGGLLETIDIAASSEGFETTIQRRTELPETQPTYDVELIGAGRAPHPLLPHITGRVTQRRPMKTEPLTDAQRTALEQSVGDGYTVLWKQTKAERRAVAKLLFTSAWIRLTIREAFDVHRKVIEWDARYSEDRIPDQAVGLDPAALRLMRWAMGSFARVRFMNRYLAGTLLPRVQLDYRPAMRCAAHFLILSERPLDTLDAWIDAGRALQRFWLTATQQGLLLQPEMTPLIFSRYVEHAVRFTDDNRARARAEQVRHLMSSQFGGGVFEHGAFLGRVGIGQVPRSRSTRMEIEPLLVASDS